MLGLAFLAFPFVFGVVPLFRIYDPYQLILRELLKHAFIVLHFESQPCRTFLNFIIKLISSSIFAVTALHGACCVFSVMVLMLMVVHAIQKESANLYDPCLKPVNVVNASKKYQVGISNSSIPRQKSTKLNSWLRNYRSKAVMKMTTSFAFPRCLRLFKVLYIMLRIGSLIVSQFLTVLVGMGILAAVSSGYVMIMCYEQFPVILYASYSLILPIAMIIDFLLITLAAVPNRKGKNFRRFWRRYVNEKREHLQLNACPNIGYSFGIVQNVQEKTALTIADTIINGTATVCLMRVGRAKLRI